jgi:hypothetical protein
VYKDAEQNENFGEATMARRPNARGNRETGGAHILSDWSQLPDVRSLVTLNNLIKSFRRTRRPQKGFKKRSANDLGDRSTNG